MTRHNPPSHFPGPAITEENPRIAFLGPHGTFTEQAVWQIAPAGSQIYPHVSVSHALDAVRNGTADRAVVPIENSIEGGVNSTLDALSTGEPLVIVAEMLVNVSFHLATKPGTDPSSITKIGTHPHAWAQCRNWVERTYPGAIHVPTTSTAAAAELVANNEAPFDAALCNTTSVSRYNLEALHADVADNPGAVTRFIMAARPGTPPPVTGADKTTIVVALAENRAGALLELLEQFDVHGIDLSRIESRPSGDGLGSYNFSIDIVGHIREERVQAALIGLHRICREVRFMGSYPRVDGRRAQIPGNASDADFRKARGWLASLLNTPSPDTRTNAVQNPTTH